jgi:hypothetical protein
MNKLTKMLVALMFLVLLLALVSCGGGGTDNNTPTPTNDQGFSPIPPYPGPNGGDPDEQTPYRTGNFSLPGGSFGDLRGVGASSRYVYVADMTTVYAFDMQGNFVNATGAPSTIQGLAVIPPDPYPTDDSNYPFPGYPVVSMDPWSGPGGCAAIFAPNLDDAVTVEDRTNPDNPKQYWFPSIVDYGRYAIYPCTPEPPSPDPFYTIIRTYDIDVTREGAIFILTDLQLPDGTTIPWAGLVFDPHESYLIARPSGVGPITIQDAQNEPRTAIVPFHDRGYTGENMGTLGQVAFGRKWPSERVDQQRAYFQDSNFEVDYVGISFMDVIHNIPPWDYSFGPVIDNGYGFTRIIGIPGGSLPGAFALYPPYSPDGGLEDLDLTAGGPSGMAVDPRTDNLFVCDPGNRRIQVFSEDGTFLRQMGDGVRGMSGNHFVAPSDLTILIDGTILVCDTIGSGTDTGLLRVIPTAPSAPHFGSVGGFVRNPTLNPPGPLVAATVTIMNENGTVDTTETNINGEYRFESLPLGTYYIIATKTNYTTDYSDVSLINDETVLVNFNLYPRQAPTVGSYVGTVYDAVTHMPVSGATVRILPTSMTTLTDTQGRFSFDEIIAGDYQAEISAQYYATYTKDVHIVAGETTVDPTIFLTPTN